MKCPCCGTDVETKLPLVDLGRNVVSWNGQEIKLTGRCTEVLRALVDDFPDVVRHERLISKVWGFRSGMIDHPRNDLSVHICKLRRLLRPIGIDVKTEWGRGFSLVLTTV